MRYFMEVAYNGKPFHGWQIQPNADTVQAWLERALGQLLSKPTPVTGAGRTDTGVHARQLFAHFDTSAAVDTDWLSHRLDRFLPPEIAIKALLPVRDDAHARFDAVSRSYEYHLSLGKDPFSQDFTFQVHQKPRVDRMNQAAKVLLDYQDFQCFSRSKTDVKTYLCTLTEAQWVENGKRLVFHIRANRFLRNMVRAVVGTLLEVGYEKIPPTQLHDIIRSKDRGQAGPSAPAHGLYLTAVEYPVDVFLK